jgi:hypothetical protein
LKRRDNNMLESFEFLRLGGFNRIDDEILPKYTEWANHVKTVGYLNSHKDEGNGFDMDAGNGGYVKLRECPLTFTEAEMLRFYASFVGGKWDLYGLPEEGEIEPIPEKQSRKINKDTEEWVDPLLEELEEEKWKDPMLEELEEEEWVDPLLEELEEEKWKDPMLEELEEEEWVDPLLEELE